MIDRLSDHVDVVTATSASFPWMLDCFHRQLLRVSGGPHELAGPQRQALGRMLRGGVCRAVVAIPRGFPSEEIGWAVELGGALLFAYVRASFRQQGIGTKMACELTLRTPIEVAYWTPEAEEIAAHGFPLRYDIRAYRSILAFVHTARAPQAHSTPLERTA